MALRTVRVYLETESDAGLPAGLTGPEEAFAYDLSHPAPPRRELLAELQVEDGGRKSLPKIEGFRRGHDLLAARGLEYDGDERRFYRGERPVEGLRVRVEVE